MSAVYTGFEQIQLYATAISTLKIPLKTSAECALDIGIQSKLIGDVLIAMTILWMGMERFIAITFPFFYRISVDRRYLRCILVPILSAVIVIVVLLFGLMCVLSDNHSLTYNCGRKSTFGTAFSAFIYISCIVSNLMSTTLNAFAYGKARTTMKNNP
uniref:G_PROTEIN_RECEP_F1_2 domain-containing protein n=1 Tax=Angiostrongylus cantonensis TaxID=6313 RepID=A0A0K0DAL2_ANGCA